MTRHELGSFMMQGKHMPQSHNTSQHTLQHSKNTQQDRQTFKASTIATSVAAMMSATMLLSGCGGGDKNSASSTATQKSGAVSMTWNNANPSVNKSGKLFSYGVSVVTTDKKGFAQLNNLPADKRLVLKLGSRSFAYAPNMFVVQINDAESVNFGKVDLLPLDEPNIGTISDPSKAYAFTNKAGAGADIAANALTEVKKELKKLIYLVSIDLTNTDKKYLPADWKSKKDDQLVAMEPLSAVYLDFATEGSGTENQPLLLKKDAKVTLKLPVSSKDVSDLPQQIGLYHFNANEGIWVSDGTATLTNDKKYYVGSTAKTATYIAAMRPVTDTVTLTGCVEKRSRDANNKVVVSSLPRTLVKLTGTSYAGYDQVFTDAQGKFSITAKKGSDVTLSFLKDQFETQTAVKSATADKNVAGSADSKNGCVVLDASNANSQLSGKLTWSGSKDYDINAILPNGSLMFYNNRVIRNAAGADGVAVRIQENSDRQSESIDYSALMVGQHLLAVSNYYNDFSPTMSASNIAFTINGQTYKAGDVAGEVAARDSKLIDRRTNVWLAAVMTVADDCSIKVQRPADVTVVQNGKTLSYKSWMTDDDFRARKVFAGDDTEVLSTDGAAYCQKAK